MNQATVRASELYEKQNRVFHQGVARAGLPYQEYKSDWLAIASQIAKRPIASISEMTLWERGRLLDHLQSRGVRLYTPGVPEEMKEWKKGDPDMERTYGQSDDSQIRYIEALWANMGYRRKTLWGLCFKLFKKERPEWLTMKQLCHLVNVVEQKAKSKRMWHYHAT